MSEPEDNPAFPFLEKIEKRDFKKKGFLAQVKEFWAVTQGGAIPQAMACKMLGISRQRMHALFKKEEIKPGTGIRAYRFSAAPNTVLVNVEDVERHMAMKKKFPQGGYQSQIAQEEEARNRAVC